MKAFFIRYLLLSLLTLSLLIWLVWYLFPTKEVVEEPTPTITQTDFWPYKVNNGVAFRYPPDSGNPWPYITMWDWPPSAQVIDEQFSCTGAGDVHSRAGKTELKSINNNPYCVTTVSEGAAGTTYVQYAYAFPKDNKTAILTFTEARINCGVYEEPKMSECSSWQKKFDIEPTVDLMAQSLKN